MDPAGTSAYVALGSNLGEREAHLAAGIAGLRETPRVRVVAVSSIYETDALGPAPQRPYLNAAAWLDVRLSPGFLLERLLAIEAAAGRLRGGVRNGPRTLDLDLLLFGDEKIHEPGLEVPHPRLHERAFVLEPLAEIAAGRIHPVLGETIAELARRVRDPAAVRRLAGA